MFSRLPVLMSGLLMLAQAQAQAPFKFENTPGRLPKQVVPIEYSLNVVPDLDAHTFRGTESIAIEVRKPTSELVLNVLNIDVTQASLSTSKGAATPLGINVDNRAQLLRLAPGKTLVPGHYTLTMTYNGQLNRTGAGFYYDLYPTAQGQKILVGTKMEPSMARSLLPCWDEPAFRARFNLSVEVPSNFDAYSNTPVVKTDVLDQGYKRVHFDTTPKMASYLLVLVAGELDKLTGEQDGVQISVATTRGKLDTASYPLAASQQLLHYYNDYFGVAYPLPKLDHIASPGGFGGAMENWGGIVYNEARMLYDPKRQGEAQKRASFGIIAHEMAHQWFGDLVTMAWWDDLWLNEGFASWMGAKASDALHPEWHVWLNSGTSREHAMAADLGQFSHPIQQKIANEAEAENAFDAITYSKGAAVIRMIENYLGEPNFRAGIQRYMRVHQYSNTTTADLWKALEQVSGKPVGALAESWTTRTGYPLLTADARCEHGATHLHLTQQPMTAPGQTASDTLWHIPITIADSSGQRVTTLMKQRALDQVLKGCGATIMIDPDGAGLYRTRYSETLRKDLEAHFDSLPENVRLKLLADSYALVLAEQQPLSSHLALLAHVAQEPRGAIWNLVIDQWLEMDGMLPDGQARETLRRAAYDLLQPRLDTIGWEDRADDDSERKLLRARLISSLGHLGHPAVVKLARERFHQFVADHGAVSPEKLRGLIDIAGRYADENDYQALESLARQALTSDEKFRYYNAMTAAQDPALARKSLALSLADDLPPLVSNRALDMIAASGHVTLVWDFATEHGDRLFQRQESATRNHFFSNLMRASYQSDQADMLESYAKQHLPPEAVVMAQRTAEKIRMRARQSTVLANAFGAARS